MLYNITVLRMTMKLVKKPTMVSRMFYGVLISIILTNLVSSLAGFIDTYVINRYVYGFATSALALAGPVSQFMCAVSELFALGCQIACTKYLSKGDKEKTNAVFTLTFIIAIGVSVIFVCLGLFANVQLAQMLTFGKPVSENTITLAAHYIKGFLIGSPFILLNQMLLPVCYLDGDIKYPSIAIVAHLTLNVGLDIIFAAIIFGKAAENAPMQMFGIGISASISYFVACIILLLHLFSKRSNFHIQLKLLKTVKFKDFGDVLKFGSPMAVKHCVITARRLLLNMIMITVGTNYLTSLTGNCVAYRADVVLGASSVESSITSIFEAPLGGIITTIVLTSGVFYSEEDEASLNELLNRLLRFIFSVCLGLSIIYLITSSFITKLYLIGFDDPNYQAAIDAYSRQCTMAMTMSSLSIVFVCINSGTLAFFQGTKREINSYIATILQSFVLPVSCVSIVAFSMKNPDGIWIGSAIGFTAYTIIHLVVATIRSKHFPRNIKEFIYLPKDFGYEEDQKLELNIKNISDCLTLSKRTVEFCQYHNIDARRTNNIASCIEEIGMMTIMSGFAHSKQKDHFCTMRILYKDNQLVFRYRSNCDKLDIKGFYDKIKKEKDPTRYVALKIILSRAKASQYVRLLNTNNIIIKI